MPTTLSAAQRERDPAATMPLPRVDTTLHLSARTVAWLVERPLARAVVDSVCDTLAELERAGHHPRLLAAVRFVLVHHEPTRVGRCRACRRGNWRRLWCRRRFPCVVWRQIGGELLGHLTSAAITRSDPTAAGVPPDAADWVQSRRLGGVPRLPAGGHEAYSGGGGQLAPPADAATDVAWPVISHPTGICAGCVAVGTAW